MKFIYRSFAFISFISISSLSMAGVWTVGTVTGAAGTSVVVPVEFTGDGASVEGQVDVSVPTTLTFVSAAAVNGGSGCNLQMMGAPRVRVSGPTGLSAPIPNGPTVFCNITYAIPPGTAVGSIPLAVSAAFCSNLPGDPVTPCTAAAGAVNVAAGPTAVAPTVSALSDTTLTAGTGSVPVTVATAGVATADLALNCSIPASTASFAITGGAARTINAVATLGANAPAIGLSCTPQSGVVTSTLTCTQTATPSETRADLTATITCPAASTTPVAPTVSALSDTTLTAGTGSVPVTVATAGVATADLALNCSIPAGTASFAITGGATRTINAVATLGANAPAIGLSCTPQSGIVTSTLTCTQTATPSETRADLTATITCPASAPTAAAPTVVTPTVNLSGATGSTQSGNATFGNTGGTAYNITSCTPPTGFSTTATFPLTVAAGGNVNVAVQCTVPQTSGLMGCVQTASATVLEVNLTCSVAAAPQPTVAVPAMSNAAKALMVFLMLGFGLVGFQLYRRGV